MPGTVAELLCYIGRISFASGEQVTYIAVEGLTKQVQMLKADSCGDFMVEVVDCTSPDPGHPCYVCLGQPLLTQEL